MKGLKVEVAKPNNAIDVYALLKEAQKENLLHGKPSERQLKVYYFSRLIHDVGSPNHFYLLAKRGRGYLGFLHAVVIPLWGSYHTAFVEQVFVVKHRRKNGVGKKLIDEFIKHMENFNIRRIEFSCPVDQIEYWKSKRDAKLIRGLMGVDL